MLKPNMKAEYLPAGPEKSRVKKKESMMNTHTNNDDIAALLDKKR